MIVCVCLIFQCLIQFSKCHHLIWLLVFFILPEKVIWENIREKKGQLIIIIESMCDPFRSHTHTHTQYVWPPHHSHSFVDKFFFQFDSSIYLPLWPKHIDHRLVYLQSIIFIVFFTLSLLTSNRLLFNIYLFIDSMMFKIWIFIHLFSNTILVILN